MSPSPPVRRSEVDQVAFEGVSENELGAQTLGHFDDAGDFALWPKDAPKQCERWSRTGTLWDATTKLHFCQLSLICSGGKLEANIQCSKGAVLQAFKMLGLSSRFCRAPNSACE